MNEDLGDDERRTASSRAPQWPRTEKQREASRENGRLGGAARQTPEGRAASNEARATHLGWAERVTHCLRGLLADDVDDMHAFFDHVFETHNPTTPREELRVSDIAVILWKKDRLTRWGNHAYSNISAAQVDLRLQNSAFRVEMHRVAADVLSELNERMPSKQELESTLDVLQGHPGLASDRARQGLSCDATPEELLSIVRRWIDTVWADVEQARYWVANRQNDAIQQYTRLMRDAADKAAYAALTDTATTNLTRVEAHLDRALKRAEDRLDAERHRREG